MDATKENMTPKEMLEKIAELDYSQSQLRDLNAEMRRWLDVADDEMAMLRSENASLKKQVKALENVISEAQQVEAEPCRFLLTDDLDVKRCSEKKIEKLEKESAMMKEQNKKLTAELKSLQRERDCDKIILNKFRVARQTLECGIEEAQLVLQNRDEVIHQKNLQLKHLEETVEECSNIIKAPSYSSHKLEEEHYLKDLKLTNKELRKQLEDRQEEASLAILSKVMGEKEGLLSPPLSFAEEIKLLASSAELKNSMSDFTDPRHEEMDVEQLIKPQSPTIDLQTKRCAGILKTVVRRAALFMLFIFIVTILGFVTLVNFAGHSDFFSINALWRSIRLLLQPYCSVQYGALPPI